MRYARPWWYHRFGRCIHTSHRLGLWCWRGWVYDGYCGHHNSTCMADDRDDGTDGAAGGDGLTGTERAEYSARFWKMAHMPPRPGTRARTEKELRDGTRIIIHLPPEDGDSRG